MWLRTLPVISVTGFSCGVAHGKEKSASAERLVDLKHLDQPPAIVHQVPPKYPPVLLGKRITGHVLIGFIVEADGSVTNAVRYQSFGSRVRRSRCCGDHAVAVPAAREEKEASQGEASGAGDVSL